MCHHLFTVSLLLCIVLCSVSLCVCLSTVWCRVAGPSPGRHTYHTHIVVVCINVLLVLCLCVVVIVVVSLCCSLAGWLARPGGLGSVGVGYYVETFAIVVSIEDVSKRFIFSKFIASCVALCGRLVVLFCLINYVAEADGVVNVCVDDLFI